MSKGLSNGTLSLRFMRNAHGGAPASLTQAAIADDGAWEVPAAVRAAWAASGPPRDVEHESSYVPFMPAERGRRTFGANGREVIPSAAPPETSAETPAAPADWSKGAQRPATISGGSVMVPARREAREAKRATAPAGSGAGKSARLLVHDDEGGVGAGLRPRKRVAASASASVSVPAPATSTGPSKTDPPLSAGFLKPAGVDAPPPPKRHREHAAARDGPSGEKKSKKKPRTSD